MELNDYQTLPTSVRKALREPLDQKKVSHRKGAKGKQLSYLEANVAADQMNRIVGEENWGYRVLESERKPVTTEDGERIIGWVYEATVEVWAKGFESKTDVGMHPVIYPEPYGGQINVTNIAQAYELAKKGAASDALKRALRTYGEQLGNRLYDQDFVDGDITKPVNEEGKAKLQEWKKEQHKLNSAAQEEVKPAVAVVGAKGPETLVTKAPKLPPTEAAAPAKPAGDGLALLDLDGVLKHFSGEFEKLSQGNSTDPVVKTWESAKKLFADRKWNEEDLTGNLGNIYRAAFKSASANSKKVAA